MRNSYRKKCGKWVAGYITTIGNGLLKKYLHPKYNLIQKNTIGITDKLKMVKRNTIKYFHERNDQKHLSRIKNIVLKTLNCLNIYDLYIKSNEILDKSLKEIETETENLKTSTEKIKSKEFICLYKGKYINIENIII